MKYVIAHVPCIKCSLFRVIDNLNQNVEGVKIVPLQFSIGKLNVSDIWWFVKHYAHHKDDKGLVLWNDTPTDLEAVRDRLKVNFVDFPKSTIFATSKWNAEMMQRVGMHVDGILPRPVNEKVALKYVNEPKDYDFVVIGQNIITHDKKWFRESPFIYIDGDRVIFDKKGMSVVKRVKGKKIVVAEESFADFKPNTLSEDDKYRLLARARFYLATSRAEGFGMPPVEAMAVGTVPIFNECHAYGEWLKGLSVKCQGYEVIDTPAGAHRFWLYDEKEYLELTEYAKGMGKEEYEDLRAKVMEHAKMFYAKNVWQTLKLFL